jgi:SOS-response transcriptional repressor LexA
MAIPPNIRTCEGYHRGPRPPRAVVLAETGRRILRFLRAYHAEHSWMPTVREMADGLGIASTSTVAFHLDRLERGGWIVQERGQARCIRLTLKGVEATE